MSYYTECPLCTSGNISLHLVCKDSFISGEDFELYKCSACGFVFTQNHPDEAAIKGYYESDEYISHSDTSKGFLNKIYRVSRNLMLSRKRNIVKDVSGLTRGNLLDIGSGTGHFALTMKKAGWQVKGIEINEKARDFSISHFKLEVISPDQIPKLESDSFDCITLWHVLEHFHDPYKYFSDIKRLLKSGGICIVAVPNCSSYDARHYSQHWAAYDVPRHLWHFNPGTFAIFAEKTGFSVKKIMILPLDVFYISILSEKYLGKKLTLLRGMIKALPFAFLSLFKKNKSSSVIYILKKRSDQ